MSETIRIRRKTLKLPSRTSEFSVGRTIDGYHIEGILSIDKQKTVFQLDRNAVLCVRHSGYRLDRHLLLALQNDTHGLVRVLHSGEAGGCFYTIDERLRPLPDWSSLNTEERKRLVRGLADAVKALHDLGFCHLDIKPEHFGTDSRGEIRLIDLDSARRFDGALTDCDTIEYTPQYAAPEIFFNRFSTASDYYSLGVSLLEMADYPRRKPLIGWISVISEMCRDDINERYNYNQIIERIVGATVEKPTGPRIYAEGKAVGARTAYSPKQLALYLSESYTDAVAYCRRNHVNGSCDAAAVAKAIREADPSYPLYWYGKAYETTAEIGRDMSADLPRMNERMVELLRSGILLEYSQFATVDSSALTLLREAAAHPEENYWAVSRLFGGQSPAPRVVITHQDYFGLRRDFNALVREKIQNGDPVQVASLLNAPPPADNRLEEEMIRWRSVVSGNNRNLTNIPVSSPFGEYVETRLPDPAAGNYGDDPDIARLFPEGRRYLIPSSAFENWRETYVTVRESKRRRRRAIFKGIGWAGLAALILAALPYILAIAAVLLVLAIIIGIALSG